MEWFTTLLANSPATAIIAMLVFILGGVVNMFILVEKKFGLFGNKEPSLNKVMEEVQLISNNHLSHLPDTELAISRIEGYSRAAENKLDKINDNLIAIKTLLEQRR